ncbi:hypothetical protein QBC38DRAFT_449916 [Podospora fimiseda]|uniref:Uncharacterized protein n=1 Tax=Podospora fimiseda TaxID=252190 RepID=A0AAN7BEN6_9PEZI|nr:hypothetical protein QBC38DRAFT_449916 [Podospora fimiseda]
MALMRDKTKEDEAASFFLKSHEAFGKIPGNPIEIRIRQERPAIHLSLVYTLRGELDKAEEILLSCIHAREEKFGVENAMIEYHWWRSDVAVDTSYCIGMEWPKSSQEGAQHKPGRYLFNAERHYCKGFLDNDTSLWARPLAANQLLENDTRKPKKFIQGLSPFTHPCSVSQ